MMVRLLRAPKGRLKWKPAAPSHSRERQESAQPRRWLGHRRRTARPHSGPLISRRVVGIPVAYARSRESKFRTVVECHRPPRAVRMPRAFSAFAIASKLVAPVALMLLRSPAARSPRTDRHRRAAPRGPSRRLRAYSGDCRASPLAPSSPRAPRGSGPISTRPFLLGERGVQVEHERVRVSAQLGDNERHAVAHQAADEMHVAGEPVELRD